MVAVLGGARFEMTKRCRRSVLKPRLRYRKQCGVAVCAHKRLRGRAKGDAVAKGVYDGGSCLVYGRRRYCTIRILIQGRSLKVAVRNDPIR